MPEDLSLVFLKCEIQAYVIVIKVNNNSYTQENCNLVQLFSKFDLTSSILSRGDLTVWNMFVHIPMITSLI